MEFIHEIKLLEEKGLESLEDKLHELKQELTQKKHLVQCLQIAEKLIQFRQEFERFQGATLQMSFILDYPIDMVSFRLTDIKGEILDLINPPNPNVSSVVFLRSLADFMKRISLEKVHRFSDMTCEEQRVHSTIILNDNIINQVLPIFVDKKMLSAYYHAKMHHELGLNTQTDKSKSKI